MAANKINRQLDDELSRCIGCERQSFSKLVTDYLCQDVAGGSTELIRLLSHKRGLFGKLIEHLGYPDILRLADTFGGHLSFSDPELARSAAAAIGNVIARVDIAELRQPLTGNEQFDRSREFSEVMNQLFCGADGAEDISAALYQCYRDGRLSMNMLDEMTEMKASAPVSRFP